MLLKALPKWKKKARPPPPSCCMTREREWGRFAPGLCPGPYIIRRNSLCLYFSIILATPLTSFTQPFQRKLRFTTCEHNAMNIGIGAQQSGNRDRNTL